ncbi:hypothetical protein P2318_08080 [Myxococcaceae bacterium GXIMD 01537]
MAEHREQRDTGADLGMLGRYRLRARLARGGMAELFLADLSGPDGFEKPVVIKRMLPQLATQETYRQTARKPHRRPRRQVPGALLLRGRQVHHERGVCYHPCVPERRLRPAVVWLSIGRSSAPSPLDSSEGAYE